MSERKEIWRGPGVTPGGPGPVTVLFTHFGNDWIRGSETVLLDLLRNIDPARVRPVVWCNAEEMREACAQLGIPAYRSDFAYYFDYDSPAFNPARYIKLVRDGLRIAREEGVEVLHANSAAPNQWLLPVARISGLPLLAHLHIDYLKRSRYACLLHLSTIVVGVSRQVLDDFVADGMSADRLRVIYNGIDFARIDVPPSRDPRRELGIAPDAILITSVGSLIRRKGHDILLQAFARLSGNANLHLVLASGGPDLAELKALAANLGLGERVHFLNGYDAIADLYRQSDLVALASRADAFGLVFAEAGYFGLPVVGTTVGGVPEVVEHEQTGLLVPPEDPEALASALGKLISDADARKSLGSAGRERVKSLFGVQAMAGALQDTYEGLAASRGAVQLPHSGRLKPYWRLATGQR